MFSKDIGIDLGTANTLVYMKGKGIIIREPSVVAVDTRTDTVKCVGQEAKDVIGRTPGSIVAVRPLKDGVIADFDITVSMLQEFIRRAVNKSMFSRPNVVICIPSGVTEVERRQSVTALPKQALRRSASLKSPWQRPSAPTAVAEPTGSMVVDIGGGTSEVAVISLGALSPPRACGWAATSSTLPSSTISRKIQPAHRRTHRRKHQDPDGSAYPLEEEVTMDVKGRNLLNGLPQNITIASDEIREALAEPVSRVLDAIRVTFEKTPPELAADVIDQGVTLTGGGALLRGLDKLINEETGMPVNIAEDPLDCVAKGAGSVLDHFDKLGDVLTDDD